MNDNKEKSFSDKLANIADEAEKDPARKKIDPLENYEIEGPDVSDPADRDAVTPVVPLAPVGGGATGVETQDRSGNVAPIAPLVVPELDDEDDENDERMR